MGKKDQEIVEAIRKGENQLVLNELYTTVLPSVVGYVTRNSGTEDEGKDIFQDAVVIFYKQVKMHQLELTTSISAYLLGVSRNLWINKAKRDKRKVQWDEAHEQTPDENKSQLSLLMSREREQVVMEILNQLGDKCAQLLRYVFFLDYSLAEVTELMGVSSSEVAHTMHYRCKKKLIKLVGKNDHLKELLQNSEQGHE